MNKTLDKKSTKEKLLEAAFLLVREKGYSSTTVDQLCEFVGVTKGSFFHYFESKETWAVESAKHWSFVTGKFFATASYHELTDPLDRILGYVDFRKRILRGKSSEFTCLVGTMVQEAYESHPEIRKACQESIFSHARTLESDIKDAIDIYKPNIKLTPQSLALHTQAVLQGAFILAKASQDPKNAIDSIDHLKNYIRLLFENKKTHKKRNSNV